MKKSLMKVKLIIIATAIASKTTPAMPNQIRGLLDFVIFILYSINGIM